MLTIHQRYCSQVISNTYDTNATIIYLIAAIVRSI